MIWDKTFLEIAHLIAKHSTCAKLQVGAILVQDRRIISMGYNGVPSGIEHCNVVFDEGLKNLASEEILKEHKEFQLMKEIHAEINCISYAARHGIKTEEATMYITHSPCNDCGKALIASGIKRVVYNISYYGATNFELLHKAGVEIIKYDMG